MNITFPPFGLGSLIAIIVLIVVVVLFIIGHIPGILAGFIGALALARLT